VHKTFFLAAIFAVLIHDSKPSTLVVNFLLGKLETNLETQKPQYCSSNVEPQVKIMLLTAFNKKKKKITFKNYIKNFSIIAFKKKGQGK